MGSLGMPAIYRGVGQTQDLSLPRLKFQKDQFIFTGFLAIGNKPMASLSIC